MPEPIINLQRRLTIAGAIRAGGEKPERGVGRKLEAFRLTSRRRDLVEQAARLYGGTPSEWTSSAGPEWQVYTEAESLPVLLMPSYSLRQTYELWEGATKRTRLCDGDGSVEELSGKPCLCEAERVDRCDLYSRLVVALPELDSVLGWRLITRGQNAAHELPTMTALAERVGAGSTFVPAQLRLDSRRGVKDGQVVRFVVPVLDLGVGYLALAGGRGGSPDGTRAALLPPPGGTFATIEQPAPDPAEAFAAVAQPVSTEGRGIAEFGEPSDDFGGAPPVPEDPALAAAGESYEERRQTLRLTEPQATKLNVLVGKLRGGGWITTDSLWVGVGKLRGRSAAALAFELGGRDEAGVLHWSPLRETLTRPEASTLVEWLEEKQRRVEAGQAERVAQAAATPQGPGDLPEGY